MRRHKNDFLRRTQMNERSKKKYLFFHIEQEYSFVFFFGLVHQEESEQIDPGILLSSSCSSSLLSERSETNSSTRERTLKEEL